MLWSLYDWRFSAVTLAAVGGYIAFSVILSEWRIKFVRRMNDADTEANAKAIDSLLNYETVKYFGNEEHEARRFDVGRRRYEQAAIRSSRTLSLLNVGQGAIISVRAGRGHGHGGLWREGRHHDAGRLRGGQRLPDPALHAARTCWASPIARSAMRWSTWRACSA